uniref:Ribonuclease H-like domain-containing protein n=1 Tax=Tanacetum cinerariifolium TaxID=118510 RepID=A0A699GX06_TANCI|nr:ribonuclease H-like domain-containing protein [Tanacetum cinerariifolium]
MADGTLSRYKARLVVNGSTPLAGVDVDETFSPVVKPDLIAYSDADWAGCLTTCRSTSSYCVFLGNNILSWCSKRHPMLSRSSVEAAYRGVVNAISKNCWLRNLLLELHTLLSSTTLVYCDNARAVYLSCNLVQHQRTKHIEIHIHFIHDLVAAGEVRVLHVPSRYQFVNILTNGLPSALFEEFRSSLNVCSPPALIAGSVSLYCSLYLYLGLSLHLEGSKLLYILFHVLM